MEKGKSLGNKVVLAKIPREEFSRFQQYCDQNGETINASLRRMILSEIEKPQPPRIAARSIFQYDKSKDNFAWKVVLDDETHIVIDDNLSSSSLEQLSQSLMTAIEERNFFIQKNRNGSVSFPTRLLRRRR